MFKKNVSGQFLFFDLVSVLSGYLVTGFSGQISGTRWTNTGNRTVLSGNIVEVSGGMYRANLFDWDTSGDYMSYLFTASGCLPRSFMIITDGAVSGRIHIASGPNVVATATLGSGALSGQKVDIFSGNLVTVLSGTLIAEIASGTIFLASGHASYIYSGQLSGHQIDLLSGRSFVASGIFVTAMVSVASGTTYLASGHDVGLRSGQSVLIYSGQQSGHVIDLLSGRSYIASGQNVTVPIASISGNHSVVPIATISGTNVVVPIATISGTVPNVISGVTYIASGQNVVGTFTLGSGALSGQKVELFSGSVVTLLSGQSYIASGVTVAVPIASISGTNVVVPIATISGTVPNVISGLVQLASGQVTGIRSGQEVLIYSGQLSGHQPNLLSGRSFVASGINVVAVAAVQSGVVFLASGHMHFWSGQLYPQSGLAVLVRSGQLSGHVIDLLSGRSYTASGIFGTATATVTSGLVWLASGHNHFWSGQLYPQSGLAVLVQSGQLSGHVINLLSGRSFVASGHNAIVPTEILSGTNVVIPPATLSGVNAIVPAASLSGVVPNVLSGTVQIASGPFVVASVTLGSGTVFLASGTPVVAAVVNDKSGYTLHSSGLDTVSVEAGMNARQSLAAIAAATAGRLSGAGTAAVRIDGANVSGTNRIAAVVDASGNRTSVILTLPG